MQNPNVTLTDLAPGSGGSVTLPMPDTIQVDRLGNVSVTWANPTSDLRNLIEPFVSKGLAQHRNRCGYYLVVADPGAVFVRLDWQEWEPYGTTPRSRSVKGAAALTSHSITRPDERLVLTVYQANAIYERITGVVRSA